MGPEGNGGPHVSLKQLGLFVFFLLGPLSIGFIQEMMTVDINPTCALAPLQLWKLPHGVLMTSSIRT